MSCLFNSLSHLLKINSNEMRQIICDYLAENKPIMEDLNTHEILAFEQTSPATYISRMRLPQTWGGAIEIGAACNIWKIRIMVENRRSNTSGNRIIEFLPLKGTEMQKTLHIYWTGGHYEPQLISDERGV